MSEVVTIEAANLAYDARDHESTLARLGGRLKFTGCRECGSDFGMYSIDRETVGMFCNKTIVHFAPWYRDPGNDRVLYLPCSVCNPDSEHMPANLEPLSVEGVTAWLDRNPMSPDYATLAAEPEAATAGQDSRASAGLEG